MNQRYLMYGVLAKDNRQFRRLHRKWATVTSIGAVAPLIEPDRYEFSPKKLSSEGASGDASVFVN
jgi:hypothetical protein